MASLAPSGRVVQGKYEGKEVYVWVENKSLMIHNGEFKKGLFSSPTSCQLYEINSVSIVDYQEMGSLTQSANPEAVLKAGFWFGAVAALAASQIGTQEIYSIAIEYPDGERSLLQLNSFAYKTFKTIAFSIDETKRKTQKQTLPKPAKIYEQESPINQKSTHEVLPTVEKRQIIINENNLQASLKRAFLFLEDEEWETANEYFESILDVDPEYAEISLIAQIQKNESLGPEIAPEVFIGDSVYSFGVVYDSSLFLLWSDYISNDFLQQNKINSIVVGKGISYISEFAFDQCVSLKTVFISEGVIKIGDSAFNGCNGLRKIILPGSVKVVGKYAFRCCENLSDVSFIGSNLKTIGEGAFFQCKSLTSITLPDSVSWIGKDAFSCCEQLSEAHLPQNVTIDANAFKFTKVIL